MIQKPWSIEKMCPTKWWRTTKKPARSIFKFQTEAITKLESRGLTVQEQLAVLMTIKSKLSDFELVKLYDVLSKNPDVSSFEN